MRPERSGTMRRVRIIIRYYDEHGVVLLEDEPSLHHLVRVPVNWTRWEIYWDEELVQSGGRDATPRPGREPTRG